MMWLSKTWMTLLEKTFTNCFHKFGVSKEAATSAIADDGNISAELYEDEEDAVKALATNLNVQRTNYSDQVDTNLAMNTLTLIENCQPTKVS